MASHQMSTSSSFPSGSPQPQWPHFAQVRQFYYTHTQPQWTEYEYARLGNASGPIDCRSPYFGVIRPASLEPHRVCFTCKQLKQNCSCSSCHVCQSFLRRGSRHHCRRCWHAVCAECWTKYRQVHPLGRPMLVCDKCAVPWALASLCKREDRGIFWGLYLLRRAGEMPCICLASNCSTLTYRTSCYRCRMPTVMTQPHVERVVRFDGVSTAVMDQVRVLNLQQRMHRAMAVNDRAAGAVDEVFRIFFHRYEELLAFRAITTAALSQRVLLSLIAAAVSYEYDSAPDLTLAFSDVPYARLLKIEVSRPRYTIFEAPGRIKYISFPGTHNWRTRWVDMQFSHVVETSWTMLHDGVRLAAGAPGDAPRQVCGGVRKVWEYSVHKGFAQEAQEAGLPLEQLIYDVRHGGYHLIFSGHSLGGAVAQYITLQLLNREPLLFAHEESSDKLPRILCVTMGAPLLGNYQLVDRVVSCGWNHLFHNFVYRSDVVPRLACSDELSTDVQMQLMDSIGRVYKAAQSWFAWRKPTAEGAEGSSSNRRDGNDNDAVRPLPEVLTTATSQLGDLTLMAAVQAQARLADYVDTTIRTGRDLLEADGDEDLPSGRELEEEMVQRDADVEAALQAVGERRAQAAASSASSSFAAAASARKEESEVLRLPSDVVIPNRRRHRRFTCFGRYHFLCYGSFGYVSTDDSETAYGVLKHGCGEPTALIDHSVASYNRGIMVHLYSGVQ